MVQVDLRYLPTSAELPCSDDKPVDNEDQNFLPNFLLFLLQHIWKDRMDWFFTSDMGIYHTAGDNPKIAICPDGFLCLGVDRRKPGNKSRRSYVVWEEKNIAPSLTLEVVSWTPGGEYDEKLDLYRKMGVLYYVVYNPEFWQRDNHQPFEVYRLVNGDYQLQQDEPLWMPEIGLGIGRSQQVIANLSREVLAWFNQTGDRCISEAEAERLRAEAAEQRVQQLVQENQQLRERLKSLGIDLEEI
jgi:Uma2 family endonuclease